MTRCFKYRWLHLLSSFLLLPGPLEALKIRSTDKSVVGEYQRVFGPQGSGVSINPLFSPDASLFSGMAWPAHPTEWFRSYSLISPVHFIGAAHYLPDLEWKLRFLGKDGVTRDYGIESVQVVKNDLGQATDLFVGKLKESVDLAQIDPFEVYNPADEVYAGKDAIIFGKVSEAMTRPLEGEWMLENRPGFDTTRYLYLDYDPVAGNAKDIHYEGGDSGSPAFVMEGGLPALVGVASTRDLVEGELRSSMSLVPFYAENIDSIMEKDGYHLTRAIVSSGLSWNQGAVPVADLVQGKAGAIALSFENQSDEAIHNLEVSVGADHQPDQVSGSGWLAEKQPDGSWRCRRGGIGVASTATLSAVWNSLPESLALTWTAESNGIAQASSNASFPVSDVLGTLSEGCSLDVDLDFDGISDALEIAFGGDPTNPSSLNLVGGELLPIWEKEGSGFELRFSRRRPAFAAGQFYLIESSSDVVNWSGDLPVGTQLAAKGFEPEWPGFEQVAVKVPASGGSAFFRLRYLVVD